MNISRRYFLGAAAAAASASLLADVHAEVSTETPPAAAALHSKLYKARITAVPTDAICEEWKSAGFEGIEVTKWDIPLEDAKQNRLIAEKHELRVHSVMRGWTNFNQPDKLEGDIASVEQSIHVASAYGADTVLLVPCRIGEKGMKMPEPWNFDIDFDPQTLKIKTVTEGDNAPYADYIAAHNAATEASIKAVESLIPAAAKEGIRIGIENVWNNLWCTPKFFAAFCKYFDNPWIGCYFDLGNHTRYAKCEEWIKALGSSMIKLHIKGYKVDEVKGKLGGGSGNWSRIDQASIDWQAVRKLLAEIPYSGWLTIEEGGTTSEEYSKILDQIIG